MSDSGRLYSSKRSAVTFIEVMVAFLLLTAVGLPVFFSLTHAVTETERFYTETVAISRAKFVMDTIMFQIPWRALQENRSDELYCRFKDPKNVDGVVSFLQRIVPRMLGDGTIITGDSKSFRGDGVYTCGKGFKYCTRVKVVDLDQDTYSDSGTVRFKKFPVPADRSEDPYFRLNELTPKDSNGKYNLIKKIILQIKWSDTKGIDPTQDKNARSIFLVGFKSNLED